MTLQIIEIQRLSSGWQVRGPAAAATPPFFTGPSAFEHAIAYARESTRARTGEIRVLARSGEVITAMPLGGTRRASHRDLKLRDRRSVR